MDVAMSVSFDCRWRCADWSMAVDEGGDDGDVTGIDGRMMLFAFPRTLMEASMWIAIGRGAAHWRAFSPSICFGGLGSRGEYGGGGVAASGFSGPFCGWAILWIRWRMDSDGGSIASKGRSSKRLK